MPDEVKIKTTKTYKNRLPTPVKPKNLLPLGKVPHSEEITVNLHKKVRQYVKPGGRKPPNLKIIVPTSTIIAYAKKGLTQSDIASILGVKQQTISHHLLQAGYTMKRAAQYREDKADILSVVGMGLVDKLADAMDVEVNTAGDLKNIATAFGIIDDKLRREQGLSTENILFKNIEEEEKDLIEEIKVIEAEIVEKEKK